MHSLLLRRCRQVAVLSQGEPDVPRFLSLHLRERVARLLQRIRNGLQLRQRDLADGRRRLARVDARAGEQGDHVRVGREANARGLRHARRVGRTRTTTGDRALRPQDGRTVRGICAKKGKKPNPE